MTIVSDSPVTLSARDETTLEIAAIIDEALQSAEVFGTYDVAKRVMEISHAHFVEEFRGALERQLAPIRDQIRDQIREFADRVRDKPLFNIRPEINLPPDVVNCIRREFGDDRH